MWSRVTAYNQSHQNLYPNTNIHRNRNSQEQVLPANEVWHQPVNKLPVLRVVWKSDWQKRVCSPRLSLWLLSATQGSIFGARRINVTIYLQFKHQIPDEPKTNFIHTEHLSGFKELWQTRLIPTAESGREMWSHPHLTRGKRSSERAGSRVKGGSGICI